MTEPIIAKSPKYIGAPVAIVATASRDRSLLLSETAKIRLHPGSEYKGVFSFDEAIEKGNLFIPEFTIVEKDWIYRTFLWNILTFHFEPNIFVR